MSAAVISSYGLHRTVSASGSQTCLNGYAPLQFYEY